MSHITQLGERPDEQQIVMEALEVATRRGLPLTAELNGSAHNIRHKRDLPLSDSEPAPISAPTSQSEVDIMRLLADISPGMTAVEAEIDTLITTPIRLIADVASHTLNAGGKRLRPALTLIAAQLCGDDSDTPDSRVVSCAAAIELTHTTTLLHDDVVDGADTRRGKPTARLLWGNETSVLVGDYLFTQVFVTAAQRGFGELVLPLAMATSQMCAGVLLETQTRGYLEMSEKQYREIIALKTASLTDCACRLGAMAMKASEEQVERLAQFGHDIGMAFQIIDDIFDIVAEQGHIGKPVGHDIREGDITLPMLRAMQVCSETDKAALKKVIAAATSKEAQVLEEDVLRALEVIRASDAVEYSLELARRYITSAKSQLEIFPDSAARRMLIEIADYVMSREK